MEKITNNCLEDIISIYMNDTINQLFPNSSNNKILTNLIGSFHLMGAVYIFIGAFSPPKYLKYHICYLCIILMVYFLLNGDCFMSKLSNQSLNKNIKYFSAGSPNNSNTCEKSRITHLRMRTIYLLILLVFIISVIGHLKPNYSLHKMLLNLLIWLNNASHYVYLTPFLFLNIFLIIYIIKEFNKKRKNK